MNTAIKCGNCKGVHASPTEVFSCYFDKPVVIEPEPVAPAPHTLSAKQENFINTLLDERPMYRDVMNLWPNHIAVLTIDQASKLITELLDVKKESQPEHYNMTAEMSHVVDGYYALPCENRSHQDLDFMRVHTTPKTGRRIKRFLGGQGPVKTPYAQQVNFAKRLAALSVAELKDAQLLFAAELGKCCNCGRSLTDELSRLRGIGPDCFEMKGWTE
jgi:hypothetical protein